MEAPCFTGAAAVVATLVEEIPPAAWEGPGLGEWDLRALVGHTSRALTTTSEYLARPAAAADVGGPVAYYVLAATAGDPAAVAERGRLAGDALGSDPAAAFRGLADRAAAAVAAAAPDALVSTPAGGMRLAEYLPTRTFELVVHGLDIAAATGLALSFEASVLDEAAALAGCVAVARGDGPLVLAALTGRRALPAGFTVLG